MRALEGSQSIGGSSGWQPGYLVIRGPKHPLAATETPRRDESGTPEPELSARDEAKDSDASPNESEAQVIWGAVAAFVKDHSYGEYIFDFQWAQAAQRAGLSYYPKLVVAAPVTPATGPRILIHPALGEELRKSVQVALIEAVREFADATRCSSIHWLFCTAEEQALLEELEFTPRDSLQYHWHNRGYADFDAFLGEMQSRKRKKFKKERRRVHEQIDALEWREGDAIGPEQIAAMERFYRRTTSEHWGRAYLEPGFFELLVEHHRDRVRFVEVTHRGEVAAGALFLETEGALYGRYWGASVELDCLHFETAYYAGIERCIEKKIPLFEAGAQGEHKLLRGFEPSITRSAHWMRHPGLHRAIAEFCEHEARELSARRGELASYGPYRVDEGPD